MSELNDIKPTPARSADSESRFVHGADYLPVAR